MHATCDKRLGYVLGPIRNDVVRIEREECRVNSLGFQEMPNGIYCPDIAVPGFENVELVMDGRPTADNGKPPSTWFEVPQIGQPSAFVLNCLTGDIFVRYRGRAGERQDNPGMQLAPDDRIVRHYAEPFIKPASTRTPRTSFRYSTTV